MIKVTKKSKLSRKEQASINAGVRTCADSCSDGCHCSGSGLDWETAAQWLFYGIAHPEEPTG